MQILVFSDKNIVQFEAQIDSQIRQNAQLDEFLFNKTPHLFLQKNNDENISFFSLFLEDNNKIYARFNVFFDKRNNPKTAFSPLKMPFGGIECYEDLSYEKLYFFVNEIQKFCEEKLTKLLKITFYPFSYVPEQAHTLTQVLLQQNFSITNSEITHFIEIDKQNFIEKIDVSAKRRIKKCKNNPNFIFEKLILSDDLEEKKQQLSVCHNIFVENRRRKNFPISIDFEGFVRLFCEFPDEHTIFVVKDLTKDLAERQAENQIIAFSVAIRINKSILYHFIPADVVGYEVFSPMIFLINGMYEYCQKEQIKILDLGISTAGGEPNFGLIRFKKSLGAKSSLKLTFEKEF